MYAYMHVHHRTSLYMQYVYAKRACVCMCACMRKVCEERFDGVFTSVSKISAYSPSVSKSVIYMLSMCFCLLQDTCPNGKHRVCVCECVHTCHTQQTYNKIIFISIDRQLLYICSFAFEQTAAHRHTIHITLLK